MSQSIPEMMLRGAGAGGRDRRRTSAGTARPVERAGRPRRRCRWCRCSRASRRRTSTSSPRRRTSCRSPRARRSSRRGSSARRCSSSCRVRPRWCEGSRRLGTVRPGDFFGEVALLDGAPRSASVVAETPIVAIRLFRRTLLNDARGRAAALAQDPGLARPPGPRSRAKPRSTPSRSAALRSRRASPSSSSTSPAAALSRVCVAFRLPGDRRRSRRAARRSTPARAAPCVMPSRSAIGSQAVDDRRGRGRASRR